MKKKKHGWKRDEWMKDKKWMNGWEIKDGWMKDEIRIDGLKMDINY
jgi:hypothetical protein